MCYNTTYTWPQTHRRCLKVASSLSSNDIKPGHVVSVVAPKNVPAIMPMSKYNVLVKGLKGSIKFWQIVINNLEQDHKIRPIWSDFMILYDFDRVWPNQFFCLSLQGLMSWLIKSYDFTSQLAILTIMLPCMSFNLRCPFWVASSSTKVKYFYVVYIWQFSKVVNKNIV